MKRDNHYLGWGLTAVAVICTSLLFYDIVFRSSMILQYSLVFIRILAPVIYGAAIAYLLAPTVNWFERILVSETERKRRVHKPWLRGASILMSWVMVGIFLYAMLMILIPELYRSVMQLISNAESYYKTILAWVQELVDSNPQFAAWVGDLIQEYYNDAFLWVRDQVLPRVEVAIQAVTGGVLGILVFLKDALVGVIISIYLLSSKEQFSAAACKLCYAFLPQERAALIIRGAKRTDRIFSGFVRGKLLDSLIIGLLCFFFSSIFKFPYAPLVSLVVGVTNVIPYFGPFLGAIPSAFLILLDSPIKCLYFCIFILALQQFDGNILGPKILGDSTGLSSFWVIVAILIGGGWFGVVGMFLGVPLFACLYTAIKCYAAYRLDRKGLPTDTESYASHVPRQPEENEEKTE
ncbi:MAG: AI-2E family transporter [Oscillospiraceae bacterium]|nr:AI-2E family transporter [Oscillospiraceae bacterium]